MSSTPDAVPAVAPVPAVSVPRAGEPARVLRRQHRASLVREFAGPVVGAVAFLVSVTLVLLVMVSV